jgi:hypothetical protein
MVKPRLVGRIMSDLSRRDVVQALAAAPLVGSFLSKTEIERAWRGVGATAGATVQPSFFTAHEYQTVRLLADLVIPSDERSGGATDAGVPEFIDFVLTEGNEENRRIAVRGGLAWMDIECRERFGKNFIDCTDQQRAQLLDQIAWPGMAPAELAHGVRFFNTFRNLVASGFWSSKIGVEDLRYMGNTSIAEWTGCPGEQLRRLGVRY